MGLHNYIPKIISCMLLVIGSGVLTLNVFARDLSWTRSMETFSYEYFTANNVQHGGHYLFLTSVKCKPQFK